MEITAADCRKKRDELRRQLEWVKISGTRVTAPGGRDITDDWFVSMRSQIAAIEKLMAAIES
jgi:hypothetical protein